MYIFSAENINNGGGLSLSPPHTVSQRETGTQVSQCYSGPPSPCGSTSAASSTTASPTPPPGSATLDPNWQATKPTVRERNAAMFNNQLMSDITFIVGGSGKIFFYIIAFIITPSLFLSLPVRLLSFRSHTSNPRTQICLSHSQLSILCNVLWRTSGMQERNRSSRC